jgi:plasmid stabilization system protein ParE
MKMARCVFSPAADRDAEELAEYYAEEDGEELVVRFLLALDRATDFIRTNPQAGSPRDMQHTHLRGLRSWPVPDFDDIRIYYLQPDVDTVRVIRIFHGKRHVDAILRQEKAWPL